MSSSRGIAAAWQRWQAGDLQGAEERCRTILEADPGALEAWRLKARIALQRQARGEALAALEEGYRVCAAPELADDIAAWHIRSGNPQLAREWLERASGSEPGEAGGRSYRLALCDWLEGEHEGAVEKFAAALAAAPGDARLGVRLARSLASLGRADEAAAQLKVILPRGPGADAYGLLAMCEFDRLGAEAALETVEIGRRAHGADPLLAYLSAALLTLLGRGRSIAPEAAALCRQDPRGRARWESFRYFRERAPRAEFSGLDTGVLARALAAAPEQGQVLEFGVFTGLSIRFIAGRVRDTVHGFDSFEGLPEAWKADEAAGSYSSHGKLPRVPDNVVLHPGWFADTLPEFFAAHRAPVRLMHVDCDLYGSTATVLQNAAPCIVPGTIVVFDEYAGYPGYEQHEFRAWREFAARRHMNYRYRFVNLTARKVAVEVLAHGSDGGERVSLGA